MSRKFEVLKKIKKVEEVKGQNHGQQTEPGRLQNGATLITRILRCKEFTLSNATKPEKNTNTLPPTIFFLFENSHHLLFLLFLLFFYCFKENNHTLHQ